MSKCDGKIKIMVTEVGGAVGQGLLKTLKRIGRYELYGADINELSAGFFFKGVIPVILDPVTSPFYVNNLISIINNIGIDLLIPGGDIELKVLAESKKEIEAATGCIVMVHDINMVETALNKKITYKWCLRNRIPFPPVFDGIISKPSGGWGSNNIQVFEDPQNIYQVKIKGREITCEVVKTKGKVNGIICMEREIYKGTSYRFKVIREQRVFDFVQKIADKLDFEGALNIQLLDDGKLYLLEINSRFSGTTNARNLCGFNSVEQLVEYFLCGYKINEKELDSYKEKQFVRYWEEIMV